MQRIWVGCEKFHQIWIFEYKYLLHSLSCFKWGNCEKHSRKIVRDHLYVNDIDESYKIWFWYGEELLNSSFYGESSKFDTHTCEENGVGSVKEMIEVAHEEYSNDPNGFEKLLIDAEKPLQVGI